MYQSMSNIQLPGSKRIYSQILTHSCTPKLMSVWINDYKNICIRMIINMDSLIRKKYRKIKWTDREYHVQDNDDVPHKYVKNYCDTNQFPTLPFCSSHPKPHGARGWVSIIIYVLIQIYVMAYVKFSAYHVPVLHVHQFLTNHGFPVFSQQNRHATNMS